MLADATSSDDSPTPGYMLVDISSKITSLFLSSHSVRLSWIQYLLFSGQTLANYTACTQLIEYLTARLSKKNHNIKYKCLVIIKVF